MPKRVDANQRDIVELLRNYGFSVLHLHTVGKGCPDVLIGRYGLNHLIEIKDGSKPPSRQKLTTAEAKFHQEWKGDVLIITTAEDVVGLSHYNMQRAKRL